LRHAPRPQPGVALLHQLRAHSEKGGGVRSGFELPWLCLRM
jgi:hypothetical protein